MTNEDSRTELSKADVYALANLDSLARTAMRSKTVLRELSKLQDMGLIEYQPFSAEAWLTSAGQAALKEHQA